MQKPTYKELLDAGCHFGHLRKKWNPKMTPYIFMEHKGIHIIDLNRTAECLERAALAMKTMAKGGKKIMFVATKKTGSRNRSKSCRNRPDAFRNRTLVGWYDDKLRHDPQIGEENAKHRTTAF